MFYYRACLYNDPADRVCVRKLFSGLSWYLLISATIICKTYDIICLQEHWLYSLQKHELEQFLHGKDSTIRNVDTYDERSGYDKGNVYKTVAMVTKLHKNTICYHRVLEYYF
jgi:hypothetical protein